MADEDVKIARARMEDLRLGKGSIGSSFDSFLEEIGELEEVKRLTDIKLQEMRMAEPVTLTITLTGEQARRFERNLAEAERRFHAEKWSEKAPSVVGLIPTKKGEPDEPFRVALSEVGFYCTLGRVVSDIRKVFEERKAKP